MMKRFFVVSVVLFTFLTATAQQHSEPCLTDHVTNDFFKDNPAVGEQLKQQFYSQYEKTLQNGGIIRKSGAKRIIPVVFHVVHMYGPENISKAQILDQLRVLNEDFSRTNADASNTRSIFAGDAATCDIEFRLATIDPQGNCTDGITRSYSTTTVETRDEVKSVIRWDNSKYLNIWVVKSIRPLTADQTGTTLGFAYLPQSLPNTKNVDGIVVRADFVGTIGTSSAANGGRTLTHEVGHYLGLLHPFENGCGSSNCTNSGDRVCDTPPVSSPSFGCNTNINSCSNDSPNKLDQIENFMDYANGNCQNMFTWGQKTIIDLVLSNQRAVLVSGSNHTATGTTIVSTPNCKPKADFINLSRVVCAGNPIDFADVSWGGPITSRSWTFTGGSPASSTDSLATVTYTTAGKYNVTLQVTGPGGQSQITNQNVVVVMPSTAVAKAPTFEGFETTTFPPTGWELTTNATKNWERTTVASMGGSASTRVLINASSSVDDVYALNLPAVDLTPLGATAYINFKVAHAQRTNVTSDRLRVLFSTDCGNNWSLLSQRTGSNLSSVTTNFNGTSFVPADETQWRLISLPLTSISTTARKNLMFRFEALSNGGNNIYLDDINLSSDVNGTMGINGFTKADLGMSIQPNPAAQVSTLQFTLPQASTVEVKIFDITGKLVSDFGSANLEAGTQQYEINKLNSNLNNGIYFVKLLINNTIYTDKLVFVQ